MILSSLISFLIVVLLAVSSSMAFSQFSLKQGINVPAIKNIGNILQHPSLAVPKLEVKCLSELNLKSLKNRGIRHIVFDKDNTLCHTYHEELHPSVIDKVAECKQTFSPSSVAILSNSVGTLDDTNYAGAITTENAFGISVIRHEHKKPACLDEVLAHFQHGDTSKVVLPNEICVVGDRVLTDIAFANEHGMYSVLVKPLSNTRDHPTAVIIRFLELAILLPLLKMLGFGRPVNP